MHCQLCRRPVDAKRRIGGWTIVLGVLSAGVTLLAVPFYRKRCPICQASAVTPISPEDLMRLGDSEQVARLQERLVRAEVELGKVSEERDFYRELRSPEENRGIPGGSDPDADQPRNPAS